MLFTPDCILCNYRAALAAIRQLTSDETTVRTLITEISEIPSLRGMDWNMTSPEVLELVFRKISNVLGDNDPFRSMKDRQNEKGLQLYSWLQALVAEADDSLNVAINLAIIGNSLDLMWSQGSVDIEPVIDDKLEKPLPRRSYQDLKRKLQSSKLLVYFADNCGEVVFDKLLVETIKKEADLEVVFVVRSVPTLNDVTLREAGLAGIDEVARVMENGIDGPLPGTILSRCSAEVQEIARQADVLLSKGGGNFDTLDEEKTLPDDTFFLLMCKCIPYRNLFSTEMAHPILSKKIQSGR